MPDLLYEKRERHAVFTYHRPDRLNAIGGRLLGELHEALEDFGADPAMRVGIVTGAGRAFSAGGDLREMAEGGFARPPHARTFPLRRAPQALRRRDQRPRRRRRAGDGARLRHPHLLDRGLVRHLRAEARHPRRLRDQAPRADDRPLGGELHPAHRGPHRAGAGAALGHRHRGRRAGAPAPARRGDRGADHGERPPLRGGHEGPDPGVAPREGRRGPAPRPLGRPRRPPLRRRRRGPPRLRREARPGLAGALGRLRRLGRPRPAALAVEPRVRRRDDGNAGTPLDPRRRREHRLRPHDTQRRRELPRRSQRQDERREGVERERGSDHGPPSAM